MGENTPFCLYPKVWNPALNMCYDPSIINLGGTGTGSNAAGNTPTLTNSAGAPLTGSAAASTKKNNQGMNPVLASFLNPKTIEGLGNTAAQIIAATKKPAPVTNNITNIEAPKEEPSAAQNPTVIIGAVLGSLLVIMLIVTVMKKRKPQIPVL